MKPVNITWGLGLWSAFLAKRWPLVSATGIFCLLGKDCFPSGKVSPNSKIVIPLYVSKSIVGQSE